MNQIKRISVIAPMRNEADHIDGFVSDLARQNFRGELEIIVSDGGSTDGSVERLQAAAHSAGLALRVVPNPVGWVSPGLNACIAAAQGDLLVRLDCHSRYPAEYLALCAEVAEETGAWNVGGVCLPQGRTSMQRAIACAMDSPFGGIGWTRATAAGRPVEVDTVTYGAFRPEAFKAAGLFDEDLVRNQDDEFNFRLRRAGGRIILDPRITVSYLPRASLRSVWRQYYEYGYWKVPVMLKHRQVLSARSLAPLGLVASLVTLIPASAASKKARFVLGVETAGYLLAGLVFGARSLRHRRESPGLLPLVFAAFPAFHFGYGLGMTDGWLNAATRRISGELKRPRETVRSKRARSSFGSAATAHEPRAHVPVVSGSQPRVNP